MPLPLCFVRPVVCLLPLSLALACASGGLAVEPEVDRTRTLERVTEDPTDPDVNFAFAQLLLSAGEHAEAIARLEFTLTLTPDHRPSRELLLDTYLDRGLVERALGYAITLKGRGVPVRADQRERLFESGSIWLAAASDFRDARSLETLEQAVQWIQADGTPPQRERVAAFRRNLADFRLRGGYLREALDLAAPLALTDAELATTAAQAAYLLGDEADGARFTETALDLTAGDGARQVALLERLVQALRGGYRFEAARTWLERLLTLRPVTAEDHLVLGTLLLDLGDHEAAAARLSQHLAGPRDVKDWERVARLFERAGDKPSAERFLRQGLEHHPDSLRLVQDLLSVTGPSAADAALWAWLERVGLNPDSLARVAGYFRKHQRGKGCSEFFSRHVPRPDQAAFALGQCALAEGNLERAQAIFDKGLKDDAARCELVDAISDFLGERTAEARKLAFLEKHYKQGCRGKGVVVRLFNLYSAAGRQREADAVVKRFFDETGHPPDVVIEIAEALSSRKLFDEGIRLLEACLALRSDAPPRAWFLLGTYYGLTDRPLKKVFETFDTFVQKSPDARKALRDVEGVYQQNARLQPGLMAVYLRLSELDPADTEMVLKLGRFALAIDDEDEALEQFHRYVERNGFSAGALRVVLGDLRDKQHEGLLKRLLDRVGRVPDAERETHRLIGSLESQFDRSDRAYAHYRRYLELALREGGIEEHDGDLMASLGFSDLALIAYENVRAGQGASSGLVRKIAEAYLGLGNLERARSTFASLRAIDPDDAERQIGFMLYKAAYFAEAIPPLREAWGRPFGAEHGNLFDVLSQSLVYVGRASEVGSLCREHVTRARAAGDEAWKTALGAVIPRLLQVREPRLLLDLVGSAAGPGAEPSWLEALAEAALRVGDAPAAVGWLQRLADAGEATAYEVGRRLAERGLVDEAAPFLDRVHAAPAEAYRARLLLGESFLRLGRWDEAAQAFGDGLRATDEAEKVLEYVLGLYRETPRVADFERLVEAALPSLSGPRGDRRAAFLKLAEARFLLGDPDRAARTLRDLVAGDGEAAALAAGVAERGGRDDLASEFYDRALDYPLNDGFEGALRARLFDLHYRGRLDEARTLARRTLAGAASAAETADVLAAAFLDLELPDAALEYAESAQAFEANEERALTVARVLFVGGQRERALDELVRTFHFPVREGLPDDRVRLARLSQILSFLLDQGEYGAALEVLDRLDARAVRDAPFFRIKATLYLHGGRIDAALENALAYFAVEERDVENQGLFSLLRLRGLLPQLEAQLRQRLARDGDRGLGVLLYRTLLASGRADEAAALAEKLLVDEGADRPRLFYRLGLHAWFEGQLEPAGAFLVGALKARDADLVREAGFVLIKIALVNGDTGPAREAEKLLLRRIQPPEKALEELAMFFFLLQDFDRARDYLGRSLLLKPDRKKVFLGLETELYRGDLDAFAGWLERLDELAQPRELGMRAVEEWLQRYYAPAERALVAEHLEKLAPHRLSWRLRAAHSEALFGDAERGRASLQEILASCPVAEWRARAASSLARLGYAVETQAPEGHVAAARMAVLRRDVERTRTHVTALLARPDLSAGALTTIGNLALQGAAFPSDVGLAVAERLAASGDTALSLLVEARTRLAAGEAAGRDVFSRYLGLRYREGWSHWLLGRTLLLRGDVDGGIRLLETGFQRSLKPRELKSTTVQDLVDLLEGEPGLSAAARTRMSAWGVAVCDELLAQEPLDVWRITMKAELLYQGGDWAGAASVYERALQVSPIDASLHNNFAYLLARAGQRLPEALEHARRAVRLEPSQNRYYRDTVGWVLHRMGQNREALGEVMASLHQIETRTEESFAEVLFHVGAILSDLGRAAEARAAFHRATAFDPGGAYGLKAAAELEK